MRALVSILKTYFVDIFSYIKVNGILDESLWGFKMERY